MSGQPGEQRSVAVRTGGHPDSLAATGGLRSGVRHNSAARLLDLDVLFHFGSSTRPTGTRRSVLTGFGLNL
jgi:hypothetical protein